uniref:Protein kinase domain-containing protein n=1 Tax=Fundulus heteroclitus TaxID=8078 RepID=A0A3Q2PJ80_FUNHE
QVVAQQLLVALNALKRAGLVHADIKPDNIMLVNHESQPFKVKLIDFGLAVKVSKLWFAGTIQAIGYRAPEVILGLPMDESVDMWALGCCLAYMYLGYNLYPTHYDVLKKAKDVKHFFTKLVGSSDRMFRLNTPAEYTNATGSATQHKSTVYKGLRSLDDLLITRPRPKDPAEPENSLGFISLLKRMLLVDSNVRITPTEALAHCFITMKHLSDERYSPNVPSAWKMATGCQLRLSKPITQL